MITAVQQAPVGGSSAPAGQRLASSIRLPWMVGLAALLTLSAVVGLLAGRDPGQAGVQRAVLDAQEATAVGSAQQVRRSLNEGSDDLLQVARVLSAKEQDDTVPAALAITALRSTAQWHLRYLSLGLVDAATGRTVLGVPGEQPAAPLGRLPDDRRMVQVLDDGRLVESVPIRDRGGLLVAAVYDPAYLYPNLVPRPRAAYVVDDRRRVVAAPGARGLNQPLPGAALREAAEAGAATSGALASAAGPSLATVLAYAPVEGVGPAGQAGLVVVVVREVSVRDGAPTFRIGGVLAALLLALVTGALFWWLHVALMQPVLSLQRAAERVGYGDLSRPVVVNRYDEVGRTGRALERLRLALIRAQVQDLDPQGQLRKDETS